MITIALAGLGLASTLLGWVSYLATVPKGTVPVRPVLAMPLELIDRTPRHDMPIACQRFRRVYREVC